MNPFLLSALVLVLLFVATWSLSRRLDNYSFVDVAWALSFAPVAGVYAFFGDGWMPRRVAVALLVGLWSLRLGIYLWRRVAAHHPEEDRRYAVLRARWEGKLGSRFLGFFLGQAVLVWLLMLPVGVLSGHDHAGFHALEFAGLALWIIGLAGEALSDAQLAAFRRESDDPKAVCRKGLWNFSRHPNYFFQSLLWWGLFLMALPAPWGWLTVLAPLAMLFFLLRVTGIPLTERLAVERRGEAYRQYQRTTSAFVPLPRRS